MARVGVLALQGDVREHHAALRQVGADVVEVRSPEALEDLDGLVLPGGESTAITHLLGTSGLRPKLTAALNDGLPVFGTCAGLILLAETVLDGRAGQVGFGVLSVTVRRNGYGRQIASFETPLQLSNGATVPGVFIRAPRITQWRDVEVLATFDRGDGEHPVLLRQGNAWGCSFHPELTSISVIHQLFVDSL